MQLNSNIADYLVIVAGSPRGGVRTWKTIQKHVLQPLDADLAICCSDEWNQDSLLFKLAKYKWIFEEYEDYSNYYSTRFEGTWREFFELGRETGLYTSGMLQFAKKDIIKNNYLEIIKKYKYIIYTRFDQYHVKDHPKLYENEILIPEGEDYDGLCDRHTAFPSEYAEKFFDLCTFVDLEKALSLKVKIYNSESIFLNHLKHENLLEKVRRTKRSQFTVNLKGEHTNWRISTYRLYFYKKLMIKYPEEFIVSIKNLINSNKRLLIGNFRLLINYIYLMIRRKIGFLKNNILQRK
tara:strand:+ start:143 stop:1024 length:882 start_codon:yes stop_codon:yes gene_type:complete